MLARGAVAAQRVRDGALGVFASARSRPRRPHPLSSPETPGAVAARNICLIAKYSRCPSPRATPIGPSSSASLCELGPFLAKPQPIDPTKLGWGLFAHSQKRRPLKCCASGRFQPPGGRLQNPDIRYVCMCRAKVQCPAARRSRRGIRTLELGAASNDGGWV